MSKKCLVEKYCLMHKGVKSVLRRVQKYRFISKFEIIAFEIVLYLNAVQNEFKYKVIMKILGTFTKKNIYP